MREETLGPLKVRITGGDDLEGGGDGPLVVLMHGFGAPGWDLVDLGRAIEVPIDVRFAFPEAPIDLGPQYAGGRAWWEIEVGRYQQAQVTGNYRPLTEEVHPGMAEATEKTSAMLDALQAKLGVTGDRTVLGGFSQGSMLALDVALRTDRPLAGLAMMSSTLLARHEWIPLMPKLKGQPIFLSHGRHDSMLPFVVCEDLRDNLVQAGADVHWVEFAGDHEIPMPVLRELSTFIQGALDLPPEED